MTGIGAIATHLAITPQKLCLGVVGSKQFDRTPQTLGKGRSRKYLPIEEKESLRWLTGYRLACQLKQRLGAPQIVSVVDCEADIYEIFVEVPQQATPADFIIRARENRCTPERDPRPAGRVFYKVLDKLAEAPVRLRRTIALPQTPKRPQRHAELEIRGATIELKPPDPRRALPIVQQQFVQVRRSPWARRRHGSLLAVDDQLASRDPPPGPQVLWTATRRMLDFAIAWLNFGPEAAIVYK